VMPGGHVLIDLVEKAFDIAGETVQGDWEERLLQTTQASEVELERLGKVLERYQGHLDVLIDQIEEVSGATNRIEDILAKNIQLLEAIREEMLRSGTRSQGEQVANAQHEWRPTSACRQVPVPCTRWSGESTLIRFSAWSPR